jgi:hypothetical protein
VPAGLGDAASGTGTPRASAAALSPPLGLGGDDELPLPISIPPIEPLELPEGLGGVEGLSLSPPRGEAGAELVRPPPAGFGEAEELPPLRPPSGLGGVAPSSGEAGEDPVKPPSGFGGEAEPVKPP